MNFMFFYSQTLHLNANLVETGLRQLLCEVHG